LREAHAGNAKYEQKGCKDFSHGRKGKSITLPKERNYSKTKFAARLFVLLNSEFLLANGLMNATVVLPENQEIRGKQKHLNCSWRVQTHKK
jgi:hypothetical protein